MNITYKILLISNILVFLVYGLDKHFSKRKYSRIAEKTLILLSLFFNGIGGLLGMKVFNHKTRKTKFYVTNLIGIMVTIILILYLEGPLNI